MLSSAEGMTGGMTLLHFQNRMQSKASAVISVSPVCTAAITAPEWPTNVWCGVPAFAFGVRSDLHRACASSEPSVQGLSTPGMYA